jgi:hypothetical protein
MACIAHFALCFAMACSAAGETSDPVVELASAEPVAKAEPARCGMAFDPAPELLAATESAAEGWSAATGWDVRVGAGGLPVKAWASLFVEYTADGHALLSAINHGGTMRHICGLSTWTDDDSAVRMIDASLTYGNCEPEWAVAHEIGHALARMKRHSFTGLMASGESEDKSAMLDTASLALICYTQPCSVFHPENSP